jgi:hypothetical protein
MNNRNKFSRGFSLAEAAISLAILAALLIIASGSFLLVTPKYKLKNAVWEVNGLLNYARYKAIFDGAAVRVRFNSRGYVVDKLDENTNIWKQEKQRSLEGAQVQANNSPIFYPQGSVSNLATIEIFNSSGRYRITLAITGRIKTVKL